ncbi:PTS sugar transporter subunit IIA [Helcococcus kunzii]|uniref:PTS sugar transporter subunit IIA n=1 Tax=Helcococcus kunzii TaxID=40091 RepID=UPI0024AE0A59|nr:fructose PTS transporter subunit IIA [Helcococcus kunzii]
MALITEKDIFLSENLSTRNEVLKRLAEISVEAGISDSVDDVYNAYLEREEVGSTGMINGFSIPHAKSDSIKQPKILFLRNAQQISDWETLDENPVEVIISFLIPKGKGEEEHLRNLATVSKKLMKAENVNILKTTDDKAEIMGVLSA